MMRWHRDQPLPIERLRQMAPDGDYSDHRLDKDPLFRALAWYAVAMVIICWSLAVFLGWAPPWSLALFGGGITGVILVWLYGDDRKDHR